MAKITVARIKQQIAALEAKAQRIAADEMKTSVSRVRSLMDSLGVTLEHLGDNVSRKVSHAKNAVLGKKPAAAKRSVAGTPRYRDPASGATWSGFGRAPGWIASAANRDDYLVSKAASAKAAKKATKATPADKKIAVAAKKTPRVAKNAAVKAAMPNAAKKTVASAKKAAKHSAAAKSAAAPARKAAKRAASRTTATRKAAAPAPMASPAPGAAASE